MENSPAQSAPVPPPPDLPQQVTPKKSSPAGFLMTVVVLLSLAATGYMYYQNQQLMRLLGDKLTAGPAVSPERDETPPVKSASQSSEIPAPATDQVTYTSATEKAKFRYPADWKITGNRLESNYPNADHIAVKSPTGAVNVEWVSALDGLGGGCDEATPLAEGTGCPLYTVIDRTPVPGAPGLFVVSATMTREGKRYDPWMAVQDEKGLSQTARAMVYNVYTGRNNKILTGAKFNAAVIFTITTPDDTGSGITQAEAVSFFSKPEVQQARQILLSLSY